MLVQVQHTYTSNSFLLTMMILKASSITFYLWLLLMLDYFLPLKKTTRHLLCFIVFIIFSSTERILRWRVHRHSAYNVMNKSNEFINRHSQKEKNFKPKKENVFEKENVFGISLNIDTFILYTMKRFSLSSHVLE